MWLKLTLLTVLTVNFTKVQLLHRYVLAADWKSQLKLILKSTLDSVNRNWINIEIKKWTSAKIWIQIRKLGSSETASRRLQWSGSKIRPSFTGKSSIHLQQDLILGMTIYQVIFSFFIFQKYWKYQYLNTFLK